MPDDNSELETTTVSVNEIVSSRVQLWDRLVDVNDGAGLLLHPETELSVVTMTTSQNVGTAQNPVWSEFIKKGVYGSNNLSLDLTALSSELDLTGEYVPLTKTSAGTPVPMTYTDGYMYGNMFTPNAAATVDAAGDSAGYGTFLNTITVRQSIRPVGTASQNAVPSEAAAAAALALKQDRLEGGPHITLTVSQQDESYTYIDVPAVGTVGAVGSTAAFPTEYAVRNALNYEVDLLEQAIDTVSESIDVLGGSVTDIYTIIDGFVNWGTASTANYGVVILKNNIDMDAGAVPTNLAVKNYVDTAITTRKDVYQRGITRTPADSVNVYLDYAGTVTGNIGGVYVPQNYGLTLGETGRLVASMSPVFDNVDLAYATDGYGAVKVVKEITNAPTYGGSAFVPNTQAVYSYVSRTVDGLQTTLTFENGLTKTGNTVTLDKATIAAPGGVVIEDNGGILVDTGTISLASAYLVDTVNGHTSGTDEDSNPITVPPGGVWVYKDGGININNGVLSVKAAPVAADTNATGDLGGVRVVTGTGLGLNNGNIFLSSAVAVTATTATGALGGVRVVVGTAGGLNVNNGNIYLATATGTSIGGVYLLASINTTTQHENNYIPTEKAVYTFVNTNYVAKTQYATANTAGVIKVGTGLAMSASTAGGPADTLYVNGSFGDTTTVVQGTGITVTPTAITGGTQYTVSLNPAQATVLGGVMVKADGGIKLETAGETNGQIYLETIGTVTTSNGTTGAGGNTVPLGGARLWTSGGIEATDGNLRLKPASTVTTLGGVTAALGGVRVVRGSGIGVTTGATAGNLYLSAATANNIGGVKLLDTMTGGGTANVLPTEAAIANWVDANYVSKTTFATTTTAGIIKVGTGLSMVQGSTTGVYDTLSVTGTFGDFTEVEGGAGINVAPTAITGGTHYTVSQVGADGTTIGGVLLLDTMDPDRTDPREGPYEDYHLPTEAAISSWVDTNYVSQTQYATKRNGSTPATGGIIKVGDGLAMTASTAGGPADTLYVTAGAGDVPVQEGKGISVTGTTSYIVGLRGALIKTTYAAAATAVTGGSYGGVVVMNDVKDATTDAQSAGAIVPTVNAVFDFVDGGYMKKGAVTNWGTASVYGSFNDADNGTYGVVKAIKNVVQAPTDADEDKPILPTTDAVWSAVYEYLDDFYVTRGAVNTQGKVTYTVNPGRVYVPGTDITGVPVAPTGSVQEASNSEASIWLNISRTFTGATVGFTAVVAATASTASYTYPVLLEHWTNTNKPIRFVKGPIAWPVDLLYYSGPFKVAKNGTEYTVTSGTVYLDGASVFNGSIAAITPDSNFKHGVIWLHISRTISGSTTTWTATATVALGTTTENDWYVPLAYVRGSEIDQIQKGDISLVTPSTTTLIEAGDGIDVTGTAVAGYTISTAYNGDFAVHVAGTTTYSVGAGQIYVNGTTVNASFAGTGNNPVAIAGGTGTIWGVITATSNNGAAGCTISFASTCGTAASEYYVPIAKVVGTSITQYQHGPIMVNGRWA